MTYWVDLTQESLERLFTEKELVILRDRCSAEALEDELADMAARVREAVAQNRANALPPAPLIPRSLRGAALDIIAVRLLKRFAISVTEERRKQAELAEELLNRTASEKRLVLDEQGCLPSDPSSSPAIVAPRPAYGNDGVGMWPIP